MMQSPPARPAAPVVRPGILEIEPYVPGKAHLADGTPVIKLSSNEGALGPSPLAQAAFAATAASLHRYPDGGSSTLRDAIGRRWGLDPARIVCGTGSDELIALLARAYAGPGDSVVQSRHGFLMYALAAQSVGARPILAPERDLRTDVDALLAAVQPDTRLVYVANPNNPTGSYISDAEIRRLHAGLPRDIVLVLDAAYCEYVEAPDYDAGHRLAAEADNVVVLRTFSKVFAMGGLRVGWSDASPAITDVLNRIRGAFNVSLPAQAACLAALDDQAHIDRCLSHNALWRDWFVDALKSLHNRLRVQVMPSVANFVLVRFDSPAVAHAVDAHLRAAGIIVRAMDAYGLPESLRITIGLESEMRAVIAALSRFTGPL